MAFKTEMNPNFNIDLPIKINKVRSLCILHKFNFKTKLRHLFSGLCKSVKFATERTDSQSRLLSPYSF